MSNDPDDPGGGAHGAHHEDLLTAVLAGDLAADAPAAVELARCPVCATQLQRLRLLAGRLDDAGRDGREVLDAGREPAAERGPRRLRLLPLLAAVAALLAVCFVLVPMRGCAEPAQPDGDMLLHTPDEDGFAPSGAVRADLPWGPFQWREDTTALDARYVVEVRREEFDGTVSEPIVTSGRLRRSPWRPSPAERVTLERCARIRWVVSVDDMATGPRRLREVRAYRQ
jgi:hypothetical protein